eukprot:gnl/TRDRNA2_/TRDRNA2_176078_c0_seq1.p1 gnl/TRDRNA2_/TRDRNA2_176078_c0~~gnl/TRDRNA2_/TRDRNA2_176078_c0_seq1.p1  ORF type:complete len:536 (-),score=62.50 gnl/TRDRNA2_/TRDRNA2_176078_c0_seq1:76-1683(-)
MLPSFQGLLLMAIALWSSMIESDSIRLHSEKAEADKTGDATAPPHEHFWPHVRGSPGHYGTTQLKGPADFNASLAWTWHHPDGRYRTVLRGGGLIDNEKNIYIATSDGIRKLNRHGDVLWHSKRAAKVSNVPSLTDHSLVGNAMDGEVFALSLDTGKDLWSRKHGKSVGGDCAYVEAHNGVVVTGMDAGPAAGNTRVLGISAENGERLWEFKPDTIVWNIMAMFPDDKSFIFMDITGGVYRVGLHDGKLIWHTPAPREGVPPRMLERIENSLVQRLGLMPSSDSVSDGGVILGPDGSAYTCSNPAHSHGVEGEKGALRKFRLSDGKLLWNTELPYPCISWPVVSSDDKTVVVVPGSFESMPASLFHLDGTLRSNHTEIQEYHAKILAMGDGQRARLRQLGIKMPDLRASIMAFDTQKGELQWSHDVKEYGGIASAGDEEGLLDRLAATAANGQDGINGHQFVAPFCLPAHWSSPTISGDGTVYVGRVNGDLYAYNPKTGEQRYHTGTGPLHSGVTFAPGMMAYADCDSLYVWNTE